MVDASTLGLAVDMISGNQNGLFERCDLKSFLESFKLEKPAENFLPDAFCTDDNDACLDRKALDQLLSKAHNKNWKQVEQALFEKYLNNTDWMTEHAHPEARANLQNLPEHNRFTAVLWLAHQMQAGDNIKVIPQWVPTPSGKDVYVLRYEPEHAQGKPVAVMAVGAGTTPDFYVDGALALAKQGYRVVIAANLLDPSNRGKYTYGNGANEEKQYPKQIGLALQEVLKATGLGEQGGPPLLFIPHSQGLQIVSSWIKKFGDNAAYQGRYAVQEIAGGRYLHPVVQKFAETYGGGIPYTRYKNGNYRIFGRIELPMFAKTPRDYMAPVGHVRHWAYKLLGYYDGTNTLIDGGLSMCTAISLYGIGPHTELAGVKYSSPAVHIVDPLDPNIDVVRGLEKFIESAKTHGGTIVVVQKENQTSDESQTTDAFEGALMAATRELDPEGKIQIVYEDVETGGHFLTLTEVPLLTKYALEGLGALEKKKTTTP